MAGQIYNDPKGGSASSIGPQIRTDMYDKKALIEARKEQYFLPLASIKNMPKNMGKTIKAFEYLPLLDDANINDQGLDAAGAVIVSGTFDAYLANGTRKTNGGSVNADGSYATEALARTAAGVDGTVVKNGGNLFGSSKDVGAISGKLPTLGENGGRVNRVGFKRVALEGSIAKFGLFDEYTAESVDFDSDADKQMHIRREMLNGASQITEQALQVDLLNAAGVVRFGGGAANAAGLIATTEVTYGDLLRLSIDLDNNRTPKHTTVSTGTRLIDTKTIPAARVLFCGSELQPTLEAMVDLHSGQAFIAVQHYAAGTTVLNGEVGSIGQFRIVIVPEMLKWSGVGGDASSTATHYETNDKYDVFPMLCVGDGSFTTIGFQTDGKSVKFTIKNSEPGSPESYASDPYGETGFMSIKWYYGFMTQRSERIGLIKTPARL